MSLRIIGCRLSGNDWDLVSLLFNSLHVRTEGRPYRVEVIDSPKQARLLKGRHPYLAATSLLEINGIGPAIVSELLGGPARPFGDLRGRDRKALFGDSFDDTNWFELWLRKKAEGLFLELDSLETDRNILQDFLEA